MLVDGHADAADAVVEERVDRSPGQTVDVCIHRRTYWNAEVAEEADWLQDVDQHRVVHERRHVPGHGSDFELAAVHRGEETVAISRVGLLPPIERDAGHFARPAEAAVVGVVGGRLGDVERLVDETAMKLEDHRLRMRVADVRVRMMDEQDFVDHVRLARSGDHQGESAPAAGSA